MLRVKLFCDWDNDSVELLERLSHQTAGHMPGFVYKDIQFVVDNSHDYAVCFNFPTMDLGVPASRAIALVLEPPEVLPVLYPDMINRAFPNVSHIYSFCSGQYVPALGLGFATVPRGEYRPLGEKVLQACMIVSNKRMTAYHARRNEVKEALMASDLPIHFYGRGMERTDDPRVFGEILPMRKYEVLNDYRFCIDFENSPHHVLTDKYFDPVLCNAVPITNSGNALRMLHLENSAGIVEFDWTIQEIVDKIADIITQPTVDHYVEPLAAAKQEIKAGSICLAEWIRKRVLEMS